MRNYIQPGEALTAIAPTGGVKSGDMVLIGNLFGIAATDAAQTAEVELSVVGVFDLPKAAVHATPGAIAYFDESAAKVDITSDTGANKRVGIFIADALEAAATGRVRLDGAAT